VKRFTIKIYQDAIDDFNNASDYYFKISPKVKKRFYTAVNAAFNDLKINPYYQIRYDKFRLKLIKKFPYLIHYIIDEENNSILVFGIRNSFQDPESSYFK
jgi:hypothetical protein